MIGKTERNMASKKIFNSVPKSVIIIFFVGIIIILATSSIYFCVHGISKNFSQNTEIWAHFGDYFGGVSNPIIALLALGALFWTIHLQRTEFKAVSEAMKNQSEQLEQQLEQLKLEKTESDLVRAVDLISKELKVLSTQNFNLITYGFINGENMFTTTIEKLALGNCDDPDISMCFEALKDLNLNEMIIDHDGPNRSPFFKFYNEYSLLNKLLNSFPEEYRASSATFSVIEHRYSVYSNIFDKAKLNEYDF